jgi:hypothetical protein
VPIASPEVSTDAPGPAGAACARRTLARLPAKRDLDDQAAEDPALDEPTPPRTGFRAGSSSRQRLPSWARWRHGIPSVKDRRYGKTATAHAATLIFL